MFSTLADIQRTLCAQTKREAAEAIKEGRVVSDVIDGVNVELKYEGQSGRGSVAVYSGVFLNGERFGTEIETHPWSMFEHMSVRYYCGGLMLAAEAQAIIMATGLTDAEATLREESYPPEPPAPARYEFTTPSLEVVVKLFKATQRTTKP